MYGCPPGSDEMKNHYQTGVLIKRKIDYMRSRELDLISRRMNLLKQNPQAYILNRESDESLRNSFKL